MLRNLFGNGAYVEGWAEYGADVMTQEGYLDFNPKFRLVREKVWLRAVANTILDIRLQTMNMTDQEALDLMTKECFQTQAEADGKLVRAKPSPVRRSCRRTLWARANGGCCARSIRQRRAAVLFWKSSMTAL